MEVKCFLPSTHYPLYDFDLRATHARTLLPAALASVSFGFVLVRVRVRVIICLLRDLGTSFTQAPNKDNQLQIILNTKNLRANRQEKYLHGKFQSLLLLSACAVCLGLTSVAFVLNLVLNAGQLHVLP